MSVPNLSLIVLCLDLAAAFAYRAYWAWSQIRKNRISETWPVTMSAVVSADLESRDLRSLRGFGEALAGGLISLGLPEARVKVVYRYAVEKHDFESVHRTEFGKRPKAEDVLKEFVTRKTLKVRHNPGNPGESVLDHGAHGAGILTLAMDISIAAATLLLLCAALLPEIFPRDSGSAFAAIIVVAFAVDFWILSQRKAVQCPYCGKRNALNPTGLKLAGDEHWKCDSCGRTAWRKKGVFVAREPEKERQTAREGAAEEPIEADAYRERGKSVTERLPILLFVMATLLVWLVPTALAYRQGGDWIYFLVCGGPISLTLVGSLATVLANIGWIADWFRSPGGDAQSGDKEPIFSFKVVDLEDSPILDDMKQKDNNIRDNTEADVQDERP